MRIVFVGGGNHTLEATRKLIEKGYEVIIIEEDEKKIETMSDQLDCGLIHGDGSNPKLLAETNPKSVDFLFGLTDSDQDNILIGLVGQSLKFKNVIISIRNASYEKICAELGLKDVVVPSRTIGNSFVDIIENEQNPDLSTYIKDDMSLMKIFIGEKEVATIEALDLPSDARVICLYREDKFQFASEKTELKPHDELIILTEKKKVKALQEKYCNTNSLK